MRGMARWHCMFVLWHWENFRVTLMKALFAPDSVFVHTFRSVRIL